MRDRSLVTLCVFMGKGMNIVFTEDYTENELITAEKEINDWIEEI